MKNFILILLALGLLLGCQNDEQNKERNKEGLIKVSLEPFSPGKEIRGPRWSPKGEKLELTKSSEGLKAELFLGQKGLAPINILMSSSNPDSSYDQLQLDLDRDGKFGGENDTILTCTPNERRGKTWSSFSGVVMVPFEKSKGHKAVVNPYPLSLWYVFDPLEADADPVIRYSRRGWMEGQVDTGDEKIRVMLTESQMDGVFDRNDSWAISPDSSRTDLYQSKLAKGTDSHNWLGEQAYGIDSILISGREVWIKKVDPQITRAEEEAQKDYLAPDRAAKRSGKKVSFSHDYKTAFALAKKNKQNLFIDFETTWCGPCKTMDQWVYTADDVISATANIVCLKVDGDDNRDLVKKYEISGYPTLILVSPDGDILKKVSGYQSVAKTIDFLK